MATSRRSFLAGVTGMTVMGGINPAAQDKEEEEEPTFRVVTVGKVEKEEEGPVRIRIFDRYAGALLGLEDWSHVNVFYWFDRNDVPQRRGILRVHPRGDADNPLTGVFACRAPVRPNLIALSACKILSVKDNVVTIDGIDAFDGTPVIDLKPVIPPDIQFEDLRIPEWTCREH